MNQLQYTPEIWEVKKDVIYFSIPAVESGLEYAKECLATHDRSLGRTTYKNKAWAETMEKDIRNMEHALKMLRACGPAKKWPAYSADTRTALLELVDGAYETVELCKVESPAQAAWKQAWLKKARELGASPEW